MFVVSDEADTLHLLPECFDTGSGIVLILLLRRKSVPSVQAGVKKRHTIRNLQSQSFHKSLVLVMGGHGFYLPRQGSVHAKNPCQIFGIDRSRYRLVPRSCHGFKILPVSRMPGIRTDKYRKKVVVAVGVRALDFADLKSYSMFQIPYAFHFAEGGNFNGCAEHTLYGASRSASFFRTVSCPTQSGELFSSS